MRSRSLLILAVILAAIVAACGSTGSGGDDSDAPVTADPGSSHGQHGSAPTDGTLNMLDTAVSGPSVQIADAIARRGEPVLVAGALFVEADGRVLLCSVLAESYPPQCGGDRLEVVGLDLDTIELEEANGVRWAESVTLSGSVD